LPWFDRGIAAVDAVLKQEPRHVVARKYQRNNISERGLTLLQLGRYVEAARDWDRVIPLNDPTNPNEGRGIRAEVWALAGRAEDAVRDPGHGGPIDLAGRLLLRGRDRVPRRPTPADHRRRCEDAAVAVLREGSARGRITWLGQALVAADPAFAELHERDDFRDWLNHP
jgi:hypothetical protein